MTPFRPVGTDKKKHCRFSSPLNRQRGREGEGERGRQGGREAQSKRQSVLDMQIGLLAVKYDGRLLKRGEGGEQEMRGGKGVITLNFEMNLNSEGDFSDSPCARKN